MCRSVHRLWYDDKFAATVSEDFLYLARPSALCSPLRVIESAELFLRVEER